MKSHSAKMKKLFTSTPVYEDPEDMLDYDQTKAKIDDDAIAEINRTKQKWKQFAELAQDNSIKPARKSWRKATNFDADSSTVQKGVKRQYSDEDSSSRENDEISEAYDEDSCEDFDDDKAISEESFDEGESSVSDDIGSEQQPSKEDDRVGDKPNTLDLKKLTLKNPNFDITRCTAVNHQLKLYEKMLECRIRMQKCLSEINRLPQSDVFTECLNNSCFEEEIKKGRDNLVECLSLLLKVRNKINVDEAACDSKNRPEESEQTCDRAKVFNEAIPATKKLKKCEFLEKYVSSQYENLQQFRIETLDHWYDRTRLTGGKSFNSFEKPTNEQIRQILVNKERLIKRTQLKRPEYQVIGKVPDTPESTETDFKALNRHLKDYDPEIFDDDDFYQKLLKEFVESKALADANILSKHFINRAQSKTKRKVHTRASKGRQTRYDAHAKLINLMCPEQQLAEGIDRDILIQSLRENFAPRALAQPAAH